jgi:4-amino-4-deoxy-L-arabinose transferase-like glycosyltransferase
MRRFVTENCGILIVLILFTLAKLPSLAVPFWWDEAGAYIPPAVAVAENGLWTALPGMHARGFLEGHPPVLYIVHGALYEVFGRWIWPHRIGQLGFALLGLWFTYRLGRLLWGHWIGVSAAILLAMTPMYFAQSLMVLGDLPVTALGVASVYFLCTQRFWAYIIVATLLLQTKETALAVSAAAALYDLFRHRIAARHRRSILMHAVPIASFALFFAIEYLNRACCR